MPSQSTRFPYLTSGPHFPGQVRMATPSYLQPLPSGQPLPRGPAACTPSPVMALAIHGWVQRAGLHGDRCLVLQAKPCLSLSAGPFLRCSHQPVGGQLSLEQSTCGWVCLPGPSAALALRRCTQERRRQCGAVGAAGGGWSPTTWVGSGLHPRHHQGLLRVG